MKLLLSLLAITISFCVYGQDPQLFEHTWYLTELTVELDDSAFVTDIDPQPEIEPQLIISDDLTFIGNGPCNSFSGVFEYDETNDQLVVTEFFQTLGPCDFGSHEIFDGTYFEYFDFGPYQYAISENDDIVSLSLLSQMAPGFDQIYQSAPVLSTSNNDIVSFSISPNPSNGIVTFSNVELNNSKVTVMDMLGNIVKEPTVLNNSIDISELSSGLYFISFSIDANGIVSKKIIKK